MTIKDVQERVDFIRSIRGDDEAAHSTEDDLWEAVLASIAAGTAENPAEMARIALTTLEIKFARWTA